MQRQHLRRVRDKIATRIIEFCEQRIRFCEGKHKQARFHLVELVAYVQKHVKVAPDSTSRILRHLRRTGKLDYEVANRRRSLYRLIWVGELVSSY